MNVYKNRVIDWIVAESKDDANQVLCEHYELTLEGLLEEDMQVVAQLDPTTPITIRDDGNLTRETLTAADWAAREGRGFLCSTEF